MSRATFFTRLREKELQVSAPGEAALFLGSWLAGFHLTTTEAVSVLTVTTRRLAARHAAASHPSGLVFHALA